MSPVFPGPGRVNVPGRPAASAASTDACSKLPQRTWETWEDLDGLGDPDGRSPLSDAWSPPRPDPRTRHRPRPRPRFQA
ncbi:hypothetical protein, partial [Streptomyces buecherae]|uniref:hypothetical protein n=1 Tax=Streptomyces buecherae TaxID=2763006 RepID=UPI001C9AC623